MKAARRPFAYVTKQGSVVRAGQLERHALKEEGMTQQIDDPFSAQDFTAGVAKPPFNPTSLVNLLDLNTYHLKSVRIKANDIAGNGWSLDAVPVAEGEEEPDETGKAELQVWLDELDVNVILSRAQQDFESIGWGAVEVTYGPDGRPVGMFYVPAHTIRIHRSRKAWVQRRGNRKVWFRDITFDGFVNHVTGEISESSFGSRDASALMVWQNWHSRSDWYGVPDIIPALGAITGDASRRDYNISFFDNYGVPAYAVFITGDFDPGEPRPLNDSDEEAANPTGPTPLEEAIEDQFSALAQNPHSVLVLTIPTSITDDFGGEGGKVEVHFEPLSTDVKEASFRMYRQDNRDEILSAHGVNPYRLGISETGSLGGSTAEEASEIYKESIVNPRQKTINFMFTRYIVTLGWGITDWRFRLTELDIVKPLEDLQILTSLFLVGAVTPREIAERFAHRFSLDTSAMDHPALNAHYIGGQAVDIEMMDFDLPADEVASVLVGLTEGLAANAKSNGGVTTKDMAQLQVAMNEMRGLLGV